MVGSSLVGRRMNVQSVENFESSEVLLCDNTTVNTCPYTCVKTHTTPRMNPNVNQLHALGADDVSVYVHHRNKRARL